MVLSSVRKRKLKREDSFNCVQKSARLKEVQGEKDFCQMDRSVESSASLKEVEGEKDSNEMDQCVESMDCISKLPDHVIHNIFSHLRNVKDAVRTSILSKRWRELWNSFSILIFDERKFAAGIGHEDCSNKKKMFRDYVSNSLQTHLEKDLYIQKLVLHMTTFDLEAAPHLDHWVSVAREKNVKELDLHVGIKNNRRYTLPQAVFSSKTMTGLRLSGCQLETCNSIMLPRLRKLYLRKIHLVEHSIQNLISGCHSIEDIRFIQCSGLKHLHLSNLLLLNRVEIHHCNQLKKVDLNAPSLHTFWYCGKKSTPCKVNLEGCKSLRRLSLEHPQVTRDFVEHQISNFPLLEKLDLSVSNKTKYVMFSHPLLRRIVLKGCQKLAFIVINAPKLLSFEYKGVLMPIIDFCPFRITEAKISFEPKVKRQEDIEHDDQFWFAAREFVKKFDPNGFKLVLHSNKNIVIHENLNNIRLPPLPGLSFEIIKSSACIEDTLSGLLRTLHPVSLSVISPPDSKFPELVYGMIKKKGEDPICCKYNAPGNKCWLHFLKDVKLEDLNDVEVEADEDKWTSTCIWYNWLKSSYASLQCQTANVRLDWNSHKHCGFVETQKTS